MLTTEAKLNFLAEAQWLLFFEKNWSKNHTATKAGQECPPWDLSSDAWSAFGAVEKVLTDHEKYRELVQVAGELEKDAGGSLLAFDSTHTHLEVVELFYRTMGRLCEELDWSMMTPLFPVDEGVEFGVMFMDNKMLKEMDDADDEYRKKQQELRDYDDALEREAWRYSRDD